MKPLLIAGMILFLLGLFNGLVIPYFESPRMGLTAHLIALQNALVLIVFGLMWKYLALSSKSLGWCLTLSIYSMYAIWFTQVLAALWGTSSATPITRADFSLSAIKQNTLDIFLYSGSLAIIIASLQIIIGLVRGRFKQT